MKVGYKKLWILLAEKEYDRRTVIESIKLIVALDYKISK